MLGSALEGFALSIGLILALGPQNVFVMRQGLMRSHVFAVCLASFAICASLLNAIRVLREICFWRVRVRELN